MPQRTRQGIEGQEQHAQDTTPDLLERLSGIEVQLANSCTLSLSLFEQRTDLMARLRALEDPPHADLQHAQGAGPRHG